MIEKLSIEQAIIKVGNSGRYQIIVVIVYIFMFFVTYFPYCGGPYLFLDPVFICNDNKHCEEKQACKEAGNDYTKVKLDLEKSTRTLTFDYQLYCDRRTQKSTAQSMLFIGSFLGSIIFGYLMDNIGRKYTQILCILCTLLGLFLLTFSVNIEMAMAGLCFTGMGIYPSNQLCSQIMSEISTGKFRQLAASMILIGSSVAAATMAFLSYMFNNDWDILVGYFMTLPTLIILIPNIFFLETPRFYMDKDPKMVIKQLNRIAVLNKKNVVLSEEDLDFSDYHKYKDQKKPNYLSLFKYKQVRYNVIFATLLRFIMMFVIYGQVFGMTDLHLNIYLVGTYPSIAEIISYAISSFMILKLKRRTAVFLLILILSVSDICFLFYEAPESCQKEGEECWQKMVSLVMFCVSKACAIQYFMLVGMYFPELFPTKVRGLALGFIRAFGECGSILSPYVVQFSEDVGINPLVLFGSFGLVSLLNLLKISETKDKVLQDVLQENDEMRNTLDRKEIQEDSNYVQNTSSEAVSAYSTKED